MSDTSISNRPQKPVIDTEDAIQWLTLAVWNCVPSKSYPEGLSTYESMWKYRLSETDYSTILKYVNSINWKEKGILYREIEGYNRGSTNLARVLILLISEWFKRESLSLNGDNAFDIIFSDPENTPDVKKIWEASGMDRRFLHQAKKMQLRQTAICVLGGFPLHYVNSSPRFEKLIKLLSSDSSELDSSSYDDLFDRNNTVFSGSLACGACKEYIDQLGRYVETDDDIDLPFNVSDLKGSNPEFTKFKDLIRNGYAKNVSKNFFSYSFFCYTCDSDTDIQAQFHLNIGFKKDKSVLYATQLRSLGIETDSDSLYFRLVAVTGAGDKEYSLHRYDRVGNGRNDYSGRGKPEILINFDIFDTSDIRLEILDKDKCVLRSFTYPVPTSLVLYKAPEAYCWSTSTKNKSQVARSVLLDYSRFRDFGDNVPIDKHSEGMHGIRPLWSWFHLTETIKVDDVDGVSHLFEYGEGERIVANYLKASLKDKVLFDNGRVEAFIDDEPKYVHLLFGLYDGERRDTLNLQVFSQGDKRKKEIKDYILEYKEHGTYRYSAWTSECSPSQGFISIRIKSLSKGVSSYQEEVYYIPSDNPISRDLDNNTITFNGVSGVCSFDPENNSHIASDHKYYDSPELDSDRDTVVFRIGDEDQNITVRVFRAFWLQVLTKDNKVIFRETTKTIRQIPILMCQRFSIRTIDNDGSHRANRITPPRIDYEKGPRELSNSSVMCENYKLYVYLSLDVFGKSIVLKKVSPKYWKDYHFYFWTERRADEPIRLETSYDDTSNSLTVRCGSIPDYDGVIFQSLYGCDPNNYYRPVYTRVREPLSLSTSPHWNRIYPSEDILFCYDLLEKHKIYSTVFSCFSKVRKDAEKRIDILNHAFKKDGYALSDGTLSLLSRIAEECGFDWLLTPRRDIIRVIRKSGERREVAVNSFQRLFEKSQIVKDNYGPHLHERYYFKRMFVEDTRYFNPDIQFEKLFNDTDNKRKDMARLFVEALRGKGQKDTSLIISSCSDYDHYEHILRDVFGKYFIR